MFFFIDVDMFYKSEHHYLYLSIEGLECKNWGEMSVTDTTFDRWELAVADDVYIRNRSGSNIGVQTFKM